MPGTDDSICICGGECKCKPVWACSQNIGICCRCHKRRTCVLCGIPPLQFATASEAQHCCTCFSTASSSNSEPNQPISNAREDSVYSSNNDNVQDELPLTAVSPDSSHPNVELGNMYPQSQDTETSESSMSDTSDCRTTGDKQDEQIDHVPVIPSEETGLVVDETLPLNPSHAQSHIETSESTIPDISDCRTTENNQAEQMDHVQITPSEETRLVVDETLPLNPSHDTETSESSMPDTSDCRATANDRTEQMDYLPIIPSEETGLVVEETGLVVEETGLVVEETGLVVEETGLVVEETGLVVEETGLVVEETGSVVEETGSVVEETELLNQFNILNEKQISHNPVNSDERVKYYINILTQNIKMESSAASKSQSETNSAKKNTSTTQASKSSTGRGISGSPQVPFTGAVAARPNVSTPPFPDYSHDSTSKQPLMCGPSVSMHQKFALPSPATSGPKAKPPFYTDRATSSNRDQFSQSVQNMSQTKPPFSRGSNEQTIPRTPASEYAISKGVLPRVSGNLTRPSGRIVDWLKIMTTAPGNIHSPQDDSTCSAISSSSSPSPVKLTRDVSELQTKTKSDKDTNAPEPQSTAAASGEPSSSFECNVETAHQGSTSADDTSPADSENKIAEHTMVSEESINFCTDVTGNLIPSLQENLNIEITKGTDSILE